jgi:DUF1680 family protein
LIRIPGWAQGQAMPSDLYAFAKPVSAKNPDQRQRKRSCVRHRTGLRSVLSKTWKKGDVISLELPMDVQKITSNEKVTDNIGKIALQRGPILYCAEAPDNFGLTSNLVVPGTSLFKAEFKPELLNGVVVLRGDAVAISVDTEKNSVTSKVSDAYSHSLLRLGASG